MNPKLFPNGCIVCGHRSSHVVYRSTIDQAVASDSSYYVPTYNKSMLHGELSACDGCGFLFISDRPTSEVYEDVYENMEDSQYIKEAEGYKASFKYALRALEKFKKNGNQLLEVGCGPGFFLKEAKNFGWNPHGIEISRWMVAEAKKNLGEGIVEHGGYETPHSKRQQFQLVAAMHVIEHISDPVEFLEVMWDRLEENGILYLAIPDVGSLLAKLLGERWWYIQIPHIYYFDRKSIARLLKQHHFDVVTIKSFPRIITREIVASRIEYFPRWLRNIAYYLILPLISKNMAFRLNTGDQMIVTARKRPKTA
jgi:SAM-dependent methyltransferase